MRAFFYASVPTLLFTLSSSYSSNACEIETIQPVQLAVPKQPILPNSLEIKCLSCTNYSQWNDQDEMTSYHLIQRITQVWQKNGIHDYMVYGREDFNNPSAHFNWQIVPYPATSFLSRLFTHIRSLWNTIFGSWPLSESDLCKQADSFKLQLNAQPSYTQTRSQLQEKIMQDSFCNHDIIKAQRVYEGTSIDLLVDYAPVGDLHLLIVTKDHLENFADLPDATYLEVAQLTKKIIPYYQSHGYPIVDLFVKTGKAAGQTQPHFHQHLVFSKSRKNELIGMLAILKKIFFGPSPLSKSKLAEQVQSIKDELIRAKKAIS